MTVYPPRVYADRYHLPTPDGPTPADSAPDTAVTTLRRVTRTGYVEVMRYL